MERLAAAFFGTFLVSSNREPVVFPTDRSRALFAYLVINAERPQRREILADLIWPGHPESHARRNLSQTLSRVRRALDDYHADPNYLRVTAKSIQFRASTVELDVKHFQALIAGFASHPHSELWKCDECIRKMEEAGDLYHGDFLQGLFLPDSLAFDAWALSTREQLHRQALDVFHTLALYYEDRAAYARVRDYAQRRLKLEPWQEDAHRQIMRAWTLGGNRGRALAQYQQCVRTLKKELGIEPDLQTTSLYKQIKSGKLKSRSAEPTPTEISW